MPQLITLSFDGSLDGFKSCGDAYNPTRQHQAGASKSGGFKVTIRVSEDSAAPHLQATGTLPSYPQLITRYQNWRHSYRALERQTRTIKPKAARIDSSAASLRQTCQQISAELQTEVDIWLSASSFNPVRRALYRALAQEQETRILIQSDDPQVLRLPWHLWEEFQHHPTLELGFGKSDYSRVVNFPTSRTNEVCILAVFGDNQNIDTEVDQADLEALSNAKVEILKQPSRQTFSEKLWEESWDILFFAGHSCTENTSGYFQLNATDTLPIEQLKRSLKRAIAQGLQLAIFNSCDGLGLAWDLDDLNIPQLILMRELVPDVVAQTFLRYFLKDYAGGASLYSAVRQARDRLESLEHQFPCATWLPVIYQNPAVSPPTWRELQQHRALNSQLHELETHRSDAPVVPVSSRDPWPIADETGEAEVLSRLKQPTSPRSWVQTFAIAIGISIGTAGAITGLRCSGLASFILQPLELWAYDRIVQLNPVRHDYDPNILIVEVRENDLLHPAQKDGQDSLSSQALDQLLTVLNQAEAAVIGLDIYRDRTPVNLSAWTTTSSPLFTICRVQDIAADKPEVRPAPGFPTNFIGFSDSLRDQDGAVRRALIGMRSEPGQCTPSYSLGMQIAQYYLYQNKDIQLNFLANGVGQLGQAVLIPLNHYPGPYVGEDVRGIQLPLHYRRIPGKHPVSSFQTVSLSQVLDGEIGVQSIQNRVVLIGTTAESYRDYHKTPFGYELPGVVLQAHLASQLIDTALGDRKLIRSWPIWGDGLWILFWSTNGGLLAISLKHSLRGNWEYRLVSWIPVGSWLLILGLLWIVAWGAMAIWQLWLAVVPGTIGLLIAYISSSYCLSSTGIPANRPPAN